MKRLFFTVLFLLAAAHVHAADPFWVSKSGSDANPCTRSPIGMPLTTTAKLTWVAGIGCLGSGDEVKVRAGTYDEVITGSMIPAGTVSAPTVVSGYLTEAPILRCSAPCGSSGISVTVFNINVTLSDFIIDNINAPENGKCLHGGDLNFLFVRMTCLNASRDGIRLVGSGSIVRDSIIRDCGRIQPAGETIDTKGIGIGVLPNAAISGVLIEGTLIEGCRGAGISMGQAIASESVNDSTIRRNVLRQMGLSSTWAPAAHDAARTVGGFVLGNGTNVHVHDNLIYDLTSGTAGGNIPGSVLYQWGGRTGTKFYNNTIHTVARGTDGTGSDTTVKNNIFSDTGTPRNHAGGGTSSDNLDNPNVATTFVNAAGGNFSLLPGSPAKDAGTSTIVSGSITLTCAGNCDQGWSEMPKMSSCSATGNTISLIFDNPRFPGLSNASVSGETVVIDGSSRTLSAPSFVGSNQRNATFSGAAVVSAATSAGSSSPMTDSALLGNLTAMVQRVDNWSSTPCSVTPDPGALLTLTAFRFHDLPGTEAAPRCLSASGSCTGMENVNASIQQNGCFRLRFKIGGTGGAPLPFAPVIQDSRNGAGYVAVPDAYAAENVKFYGTADASPDIPNHLSVVSSELLTSSYSTNVSAAFLRSNVSVPNISLVVDSEAELEVALCFDRDEPVGTTHDFRVYKGDGNPLDVYTVTPRATTVAPGLSGGMS